MIGLSLRQLAWEARHSLTAALGLALAAFLTIHIILPAACRLIQECLQ